MAVPASSSTSIVKSIPQIHSSSIGELVSEDDTVHGLILTEVEGDAVKQILELSSE